MSVIFETIAGQIILAGGALAALSKWVFIPLWKASRAVHRGVIYVTGEMKNNGGSTMRDAIDRIEQRLDSIEDRLPPLTEEGTTP